MTGDFLDLIEQRRSRPGRDLISILLPAARPLVLAPIAKLFGQVSSR
ncbi:cytochrome P450 [Arthrobacter ginsengisoli]|uniref:Cytochrome P450 n=1 Tax=Arthrobacter ginsengisoli TaxID=1356565 RepID=A0ABU1UGD6_9MICC|nr:hypothetical protein [Arthrobacter ginsengisoli]MDR7084246.1 cytochrome P450 [Arthrobacter ginsengisoli]